MGGFFGEISFGRLEDAFFEEGIELVRGGFGLGFMGKKVTKKRSSRFPSVELSFGYKSIFKSKNLLDQKTMFFALLFLQKKDEKAFNQ